MNRKFWYRTNLCRRGKVGRREVIDLKYYFDKQLTGQFARLMSYDKEFDVYTINPETNEYERDDEKTLNKCKKYILNFLIDFSN